MSELHRFARHLADSAEAARRGASREPLGLADIVTRVMPYRACRRALGLETAEDYELLLLRLLAGEDRLGQGFPPEATDQAIDELGSGNPDLGLLRRLGDATIQLNLAAIAESPHDQAAAPHRATRVRDYHLVEPEGEPDIPAPGEVLPPAAVAAREPVPVVWSVEPDRERTGDMVMEPPGEEELPGPGADDSVAAEPSPADGEPSAADQPETEAEPAPQVEVTTILADRLELEWESVPEGEDSVDGPAQVWEAVDEPSPPREAPRSVEPSGPEPEPPSEPPTRDAPLPVAAASDARPTGAPSSPCPHCGQALPVGRQVRFCPSCGRNVAPLRCVRCLSELEPQWRHCVSCGHPTGDPSRFA